ncbi:MAG: hypothetical protein A2Y03_05590 [Omnitrophica WOR_2 bacterium GWF2_38_59]|nr:MAG: hypothetical protein A2Y06_01165 [Omnitrophica WOR_2 bacterium GWA2_37_7]OGX23051.1 MAG: hypothetical protein A2Y03_05590 [Omnitrophica WOR_2 bacterium GWF2_38_59]OGX51247.1 MAG: hypothetical protein A2243_05375 [Omnitrophica WOR_2 bacterium RIFOXYA2_FULL_38_17]OGX54346.1 MAG: hypothetical protein A2267_00485 [Omnitrophica WOR_2 bacterium RIFOXYA12_FULL_38_10]OGX55368.1 MAG: hypothetical protein A2306_06725 [Omnitrophica WOR_2 bacterium RIFOXYB2_FULL_38_16]OGX57956.1 MAG: hypothetical 
MINSFNIKFNSKGFDSRTLCIPASLIILSTSIAYGDGVQNFYKAFLCLCASLISFLFVSIIIILCRSGNSTIRTKAITIEREVLKSFFIILTTCALLGLLYFIQTRELHSAAILSGVSPGLFFICLYTLYKLKILEERSHFENLTSNNRALKTFYQLQYMFCIITSCLIPVLIYFMITDHIAILGCSSIILLSVNLIHRLLVKPSFDSYKYSFSATYLLLGLYIAFFSIGWII